MCARTIHSPIAHLRRHRQRRPIVGRMQAMWEAMRAQVLDIFPPPPGLPADRNAFMQFEQIYQSDACHSLSIEGYSVSANLIERVRAGNCAFDRQNSDGQSRDALAACGYWQAFQIVKANVGEIIAGAHPAQLVRTAHRDWYRELFQPCVTAGLIPPRALAGYRNDAVYLRTSRYVPPRWEAVRDAMPALFERTDGAVFAECNACLGRLSWTVVRWSM